MIKAIEKSLAEKIASGQVVIDLSSALKELIDNSIDARSTVIEINLYNDGIEAFEIIDNGHGIPENSLATLGGAHCTSKLDSFEDLEEMATLGFRGEAFHSLCLLSKTVQLVTKHVDSEIGTEIHFDNKAQKAVRRPHASSIGTKVKVESLFHEYSVRYSEWTRNRQKHLSKALLLLQAYAVGFSSVKFKCSLINQNGSKKVLFSTSGGSTPPETFMDVFGVSSKFFVSSESPYCPLEKFALKCYFGKSNSPSRSTTDRQFIFVNGRPSDQSFIQKLVNSAYQGHGYIGFPCFMIEISVDSGCFDVNLTPDKRKVKIVQERAIAEKLKLMVENCCFDQVQLSQPKTSYSQSSVADGCCAAAKVSVEPSLSFSFNGINSHIHEEDMSLHKKELKDFRIIGQFNHGFILASQWKGDQEHIYIIDQHAADERLQLETLWKDLRVTTQRLLRPKRVRVPIDDYLCIQEHIDEFIEIGFGINDTGDGDEPVYEVSSVPQVAGHSLDIDDFLDICEKMKSLMWNVKPSLCYSRKLNEIMASKACRSAIMIGTPLTFAEMSKVVYSLPDLENPWICAHGRPTIRLLHAFNL